MPDWSHSDFRPPPLSILNLPHYSLWPFPREVSASTAKLVAVLCNSPSGACKAAARRHLSLDSHSRPDFTPRSRERVAGISLVPEDLQQQWDGPPLRHTFLSGEEPSAGWGVVAVCHTQLYSSHLEGWLT